MLGLRSGSVLVVFHGSDVVFFMEIDWCSKWYRLLQMASDVYDKENYDGKTKSLQQMRFGHLCILGGDDRPHKKSNICFQTIL